MIWLVRLVSLAALAGFAAAVWFAGPLVGFADGRPLAPVWVRAAIIGTALALVAGYYGIRLWRIRRAADMLGSAIAKPNGGGGDEAALSARMQEAVALLARARGKRSALVTLPWYVVIGPPGAGKTTALVNSGLNFPLAGTGPAEPVAGVGGTRLCDWWFAEDAVLIDTAGRYTTQDSDATVDRKGWLAFLSLLKRHRPRQPLNGLIVAISLQDFMTLDQPALDRHVGAIRARLREVREVLGLELPTYVVFTKADLVAGFMDYFGRLDEAGRRAGLGLDARGGRGRRSLRRRPFPPSSTAWPNGSPPSCRTASKRSRTRPPASASSASRRASRSLRGRVAAFLQGVFASSGKEQPATFRGFYFTSGTQEGTPIDQVIGALGREFGNLRGGPALRQGQELLPARPARQGRVSRGTLRDARPRRRATRARCCAAAPSRQWSCWPAPHSARYGSAIPPTARCSPRPRRPSTPTARRPGRCSPAPRWPMPTSRT